MAAALFRHAIAVEPEPLRSLEVVSAGISALEGAAPAANSVQALQRVGIPLAGHRSRRLTQELLDRALAVFCMTESHRALIELQFAPPPAGVLLLRELMDTAERDLPDPFGQNLLAYEASRDGMVEAIPSLLAHVRKLLDVRAR